MKRALRKPSYANVISTLALIVAVGGGTAYAASSGDPSTSKALKLCAAKKGGALRLASQGGCKPSERSLVVATSGSAGPVGPAGATGERGPQGDRGQQGDRGPQGDTGPQGVPGSAGSPTTVASPDGRFKVAATNAGIVLSGPNGTLEFDGGELRARNLAITTELGLTIVNGTSLEVTTGTSTTMTTGSDFSQTVGGFYQEAIQKSFEQLVGDAYFAQSAGPAALMGSKLSLGGTGTCPAAARVGSEVTSGHVVGAGSSGAVFVC